MSDWWAKKLGNQPPARQPLPPLAPPAPPAPRWQPETPQPPAQITDENALDAAFTWKGGEGTRTETTPCPQCGSDLYFSRANSGGMVTPRGMAAPAPRCYSCGFTPGHPMQGMPQ